MIATPVEGQAAALNVACITVGTQNQKLAEQWINARRTEWERRLDRLGAYLEDMKKEGDDNGSPA